MTPARTSRVGPDITLSPTGGEAMFGDPAMVGEWASALPAMLASPQRPPWCSYLARADGEAVGMGSFKGPPDDAGCVEIAYLTFLPAQRRGVATAVAAALLDIARAAGAAAARAHTMPAHGPSTRVLDANGFRCLGEVIDPEDGAVWRWERAIGRTESGMVRPACSAASPGA